MGGQGLGELLRPARGCPALGSHSGHRARAGMKRGLHREHKGQLVMCESQELECGAAQSTAVLMNVKQTCLQKGRAACVCTESRGLSVCSSLLCLHKAGNFLY